MKTILVGGALANKPHNGGEAWVRLSWVLGLRKLGFDAFFLEQIDPETCVDAEGNRTGFGDCVNRAYFAEVAANYGLEGSSALVYGDGAEVFGVSRDDLDTRLRSAEGLLNISGHVSLPSLLAPIARKVYVDIDPGFTQFWHADGNRGSRLEGHDHFFTIGENIGRGDCCIPTGGIPWRHVRQPVVLDGWPVCPCGDAHRFTTIASWRGPYGPIVHEGRTLGLKVHEFRKFLELPGRTHRAFEIALNIDPADAKDRSQLLQHGWRLVDPRVVAAGPDEFRRYVQGSAAEFSVAQGVYVDTRSGWFSDRTVRYLASGKPALVQDTGLDGHLPLGEGLLVFTTLDEAADGVRRIERDYPRHCRAARHIAETYFDSDRVLGRMLDELGIDP